MIKQHFILDVDDWGKEILFTLEAVDKKTLEGIVEYLDEDLNTSGGLGFSKVDSYEAGIKEIKTKIKMENNDDIKTFDLKDKNVYKVLTDFEYTDKEGNYYNEETEQIENIEDWNEIPK